MMIKAMFLLTCRPCEQGAECTKHSLRKGNVFESLDRLKDHLQDVHSVEMCSLCLEGRKVFIFEQKLYNKEQLQRHLAEGDGIGEERGGFNGHPLCNFCQRRFYGDNELYQHMSVDHFLCHICKRLHPGQYDYFHNYDDLEVHFRLEHSLCEHSDCLAKKFVVFTSEEELKRHNVLTHGGNMPRSKRNMYLQIPTSFQYRQPQSSASGPSGHSSRNLFVRELQSLSTSENEEASGAHIGACSNNPQFNSVESSRVNAIPNLGESAFPPLPKTKKTKHRSKQQGSFANSWNRVVPLAAHSASSSWKQLHKKREDNLHTKSVSSAQKQLKLPSRSEMGIAATEESSIIANEKTILAASSPATNTHENNSQDFNELQRSNRALNEHIYSRLGSNSKLFTAFKSLSVRFRKRELGTLQYCEQIQQLGLWDLVPELVRLCPEPERQRALLDVFNGELKGKQPELNSNLSRNQHKKGHGQSEANGILALMPVDSMSVLGSMKRVETQPEDEGVESECRHNELRVSQADHKLKILEGSLSRNNDNENTPLLADNGISVDIAEGHSASNEIDVWSCEMCTLKNREAWIKCAACGASRPRAGNVSAYRETKLKCDTGGLPRHNGKGVAMSPTHGSVPNNNPNRPGTSYPTYMWICRVCTLENSESDSKCAACDASRPLEIAENHGKQKKKTTKFERLQLDKESPSSSNLRTTETRVNALVPSGNQYCESSKVNVGIWTATSREFSLWRCDACAMENCKFENKCISCGSARPSTGAQQHGKQNKKVSKFERMRLNTGSPSSHLELQDPVLKTAGAWKNGGGRKLVALAKREAIIDDAWRR
ncbi:hypothetical protein KP509_15G068600 [Ceratopteris richardii]|nr:hypothetical protein KP509_15G068600 [Ceratopteris richardii]KAH7405394.1 hypothetical protein KP509_15G068600 [Ceratopteris richardii]